MIYFCEYLYSSNNKTNIKVMLYYIYIFKKEIEILYNKINKYFSDCIIVW